MTGTDRATTRRAFTMVEMMVVVAILGIVLGMTVIALNSASAETTMSTTEGALQNSTNQFVERLLTDLRGASRASVTVDSDGAGISFRVPVDTDSDGSVDLDANGDPVYGATFGRTHTAGVDIVYQFLPNQVGGSDEELDEGALGIDVNGDGDEADSFQRGRFTRAAPDGTGTTTARATSDRWFLLEVVDDPALPPPEPMFERTGAAITIRLMAADVMERTETAIRSQVTTSVRPYNP